MTRRVSILLATFACSLGILGTASALAPKTPVTPKSAHPWVPQVKPVASIKPVSKGFNGDYYGWLGGVETDAKGTILSIGVLTNNGADARWVKGCGAKISDLSHVPWGHMISTSNANRYGIWLRLFVKNGCLDRVRVERHSWPRNGT